METEQTTLESIRVRGALYALAEFDLNPEQKRRAYREALSVLDEETRGRILSFFETEGVFSNENVLERAVRTSSSHQTPDLCAWKLIFARNKEKGGESCRRCSGYNVACRTYASPENTSN